MDLLAEGTTLQTRTEELAPSSGPAPSCATLAWLWHINDSSCPWLREIVGDSSPCVVIVGSLARQMQPKVARQGDRPELPRTQYGVTHGTDFGPRQQPLSFHDQIGKGLIRSPHIYIYVYVFESPWDSLKTPLGATPCAKNFRIAPKLFNTFGVPFSEGTSKKLVLVLMLVFLKRASHIFVSRGAPPRFAFLEARMSD